SEHSLLRRSLEADRPCEGTRRPSAPAVWLRPGDRLHLRRQPTHRRQRRADAMHFNRKDGEAISAAAFQAALSDDRRLYVDVASDPGLAGYPKSSFLDHLRTERMSVPASKTAVVLSGGGAYGAFAVGVMKVLFAGRSPATRYQVCDADIFTGT